MDGAIAAVTERVRRSVDGDGRSLMRIAHAAGVDYRVLRKLCAGRSTGRNQQGPGLGFLLDLAAELEVHPAEWFSGIPAPQLSPEELSGLRAMLSRNRENAQPLAEVA